MRSAARSKTSTACTSTRGCRSTTPKSAIWSRTTSRPRTRCWNSTTASAWCCTRCIPEERDAELVLVGRAAHEAKRPVIVAGDLNDVAWSRTTRLFRKVSGLLDPRIGRGMFNTFHAKLPGLRWPLDHLFHSEHFTLVSMERLPAVGSDHFPILVELALEPGENDADAGLDLDEQAQEDAEGAMDVADAHDAEAAPV
nr:endonuclease/exonuclease/phosphatase family protein [Luteimonas cellulosilyticus]